MNTSTIEENGNDTSPRTEAAVGVITAFYNERVDRDYERIIDMIELDWETLTRKDFIEKLGISDEVLDAFFDLAVRNCDSEERDTICDRLININKEDLGRIAKKLKYENFGFQDELDMRNREIAGLKEDIAKKDAQIANFSAGGTGFSVEDNSQDPVGLSALLEERQILQDQVDNLVSENNRLSQENFNLEAKVDNLSAEKSRLEVTIDELNQGMASGGQTFSPNNEQVSPEEIEMLRNTIGDLEMERDNLREEIRVMAENSNNAAPDNSWELLEKVERISVLEAEIEQKDQSLSNLEEMVSSLQQQLNEKEYEIEALRESGAQRVQEEVKGEWDDEDLFAERNEDEPVAKKKNKTGLYIIIGVFFFIFLGLVALVIVNGSGQGPVPGTPTQLGVTEKTTGQGISANVANGAVTQLPPSPAVSQAASTPIEEAVPTALNAAQSQPIAQGITSTLLTPYDFRKNKSAFTLTEQGLVLEKRTYKTGESINGFRILMIQKTFVRFLDPKNDLEFRVDLGA